MSDVQINIVPILDFEDDDNFPNVETVEAYIRHCLAHQGRGGQIDPGNFNDACRYFMVYGFVAKGMDPDQAFDLVEEMEGTLRVATHADGSLEINFESGEIDGPERVL